MFQSLPSVFRGLSGQDSEQAERYFEVIDVEASSVIMVEGEQDLSLIHI